MTEPSERGYWPTSDWRVSSPESEGLDGPTLGKIDEYARQSMPPIRAVVIVRHGHIVFEG